MPTNPKELKKAAMTLKAVMKQANEMQSYVFSQGQHTDLTGIDFTWLKGMNESIQKLERCDWDIKKYFELIATEYGCWRPDLHNRGTIPFIDYKDKLAELLNEL